MAAGRKVGPHGEALSVLGVDGREEAEQKLFQKREKKEQERIQARFKILTIEDVEIANLIGGEKTTKEADSWGNDANQATNDGPSKVQSDPQPEKVQGNLHKSNRKRDREEVFGTGKVEDATIEGVLNNIKGRVLNGETLNNFKKDINQLVELVEKKDPQMDVVNIGKKELGLGF